MFTTPTKKQATSSNAVISSFQSTPPPSSAGSTSSHYHVSDDITARIASRAKEIRFSVSKGYPVDSSPRAPLSATRSEPNILPSQLYASTYSPSPSASNSPAPGSYILPRDQNQDQNARGLSSTSTQPFTPPRPLMPMCESVADAGRWSNGASSAGAWDGSMASIMQRARQEQELHQKRLERQAAAEVEAAGSTGNPFVAASSVYASGSRGNGQLFAQYPSPVSLNGKKKRAQVEEEENDGEEGENGQKQQVQRGEATQSATGDEMMEDEDANDMQSQDLPLSRSLNGGSVGGKHNKCDFTSDLFSSTPMPSGIVSGTTSPPSWLYNAQHQPHNTTELSTMLAAEPRQTRSLPRRTLGKTQSLPVDAFMSQMHARPSQFRASDLPQTFSSDVFNTQEGF